MQSPFVPDWIYKKSRSEDFLEMLCTKYLGPSFGSGVFVMANAIAEPDPDDALFYCQLRLYDSLSDKQTMGNVSINKKKSISV